MSKSSQDSPADKSAPIEKVYDPERSRIRFREWFPAMSESDIDKLIVYLGELNKFNKAVNLVSPSTLAQADALHLADSVYAGELIVPKLIDGEALFDFGSGNGFPGLVLGALNPSLQVKLVDRDERKLEFCKHVAATIGAKNITTIKCEVERLPPGSVKNVVSRGFAPLAKAMMIARAPVAKGGKFFHLKGEQWATELSSVPSQLFSFWQPSLIGSYRLPDLGGEMSVVLTDKTEA